MRLTTFPPIGARYWVCMVIASVCGANCGDLAPDVFGISNAAGAAICLMIFAAVMLANQWKARVGQSLFWIAVIDVRAAATLIADFAIGRLHLSYAASAVILAISLVLLLISLSPRLTRRAAIVSPASGSSYWIIMLIAGTLGTVLGDGFGHAIAPMTVGYPFSFVVAAIAVTLAMIYRRTRPAAKIGVASYWLTIVAIRMLGTTLGDIAAFLLSLPFSTVLSGLLLVVTLMVWTDEERAAKQAAPVR